MREYNYESIDKHIQWLIQMMETEFPNCFELVITSTGAEIRSTQGYMNFLNKRFKDHKEPLIDIYLKAQEENGGNRIKND